MNRAALPRKERRRLERIESKEQRQGRASAALPLESRSRWRIPHILLFVLIAASVVTAVVASVRTFTTKEAPLAMPEGNNIVQIFLGVPPTQPEIMQVAKSTADWQNGKLNPAGTEMWVSPTQEFWIPSRKATVRAAHLQAGDKLLQQDGKVVTCTAALIRPIISDNEFVTAYHRIHGTDASVPIGEPGMHLSKVTQTFLHKVNEVYQIYYGSGKPPQDLSPVTISSSELDALSRKVNEGEGSVFVTAQHPYYVLNKSKFVQVGALEVGDRFRNFKGDEVEFHGKRRFVARIDDPFTVYNLEVANQHTYFAGNDAIWVHNDCPWPVEKAISAYRVLLEGAANGNKWSAFQDSLRLLLKRGDMLNYEQRRLYLHVQDEFRKAGGVTHQCPRIPCSKDAEHSLDEFFRAKGKWVEPNPNEDMPGMGKQFDRVIDGVKTEYLSPETTDIDGLTGAIARKAIDTRSKKGTELVVDVTGLPNWSAEVRQRAIARAQGVAPEISVRFRNGDILE